MMHAVGSTALPGFNPKSRPHRVVQALPSAREIWTRPLPGLAHSAIDRLFCRSITAWARRKVLALEGDIEQLSGLHDPQILAFNHNQRIEAVMIPILCIYLRAGKLIHFVADWQMSMIPVVSMLYRHSRVIYVMKKSARPRFLNVFKRFIQQPGSVLECAGRRLRQPGAVGLFPEGRMNRDPQELLKGHPGTARLALKEQVRVLPVGIQFPFHVTEQRIRDGEPMLLRVGEPQVPPPCHSPGAPSPDEVTAFHETIMAALSRVSGKRMRGSIDERGPHVSTRKIQSSQNHHFGGSSAGHGCARGGLPRGEGMDAGSDGILPGIRSRE